MKKNKTKVFHDSHLLLIIVLGVLIFVYVFVLLHEKAYKSLQMSNSNVMENKNVPYASKFMKFSVNYPSAFDIKEGNSFIDLISPTGTINISRIATNFSNINDYLKDFDSKRNIKIDSENSLLINKLNFTSRLEVFNGGPITNQKVYYIYINPGWVYSLSTSSPELFGDLDQIARSFRYIP